MSERALDAAMDAYANALARLLDENDGLSIADRRVAMAEALHAHAKEAALAALRADRAREAELMQEAAYNIELAVRQQYGWPDVHPAMQRKYERDIAIVTQLRDAARTEEASRGE